MPAGPSDQSQKVGPKPGPRRRRSQHAQRAPQHSPWLGIGEGRRLRGSGTECWRRRSSHGASGARVCMMEGLRLSPIPICGEGRSGRCACSDRSLHGPSLRPNIQL
eukprot:15461045-Alexandrium_andersonii.AAC.1